jgi:ubiquitin carboxyl-terminal hydrolase 5/13
MEGHVFFFSKFNLAIYCYTCDNDVTDPDIAKHLKNLGINIKEQVKTEKTVTEMVN